MVEKEIISDEELIELTGYSTPAKQCESLDRHRIFYVRRQDGRPRTTWYHFNHPMLNLVGNDDSVPNFAALDKH
ncbi:MAG: DUF4224 domain-containing protein [Idiomarina sp.]|nr:DUF4224 domain-containing protein [Idiomarina sp.]